MRRHIIADKRAEIAVGSVLIVGGFILWYDAWEGRGGKSPWFLGPFKPW